ncbi:hypothetical protein DL96DRAFT_1625918 [Flagelloscypha sp. PMI_526]|nr:hypothetical protein DL96DRAFT_1625918 [Flagelloscypha sp. PMI_526]
MSRYPAHNYKDLVQWSHDSGEDTISVSRDLASQYKTSVLSETHRSILIEEEWLQEAHKRCMQAIEFTQKACSLVTAVSVEERQKLEDTAFVCGILEGILLLPIHPVPPLPLDIVFEIIQWSALFHKEPFNLTLISSQVQSCIDPILFSTPLIRVKDFYPGDDFINSHSFTSIFLSGSPRVQRYRIYVKNVAILGVVSFLSLNTLASIFPNLEGFNVRSLSVFPPAMTKPVTRLKFLHCSLEARGHDLPWPLFIGVQTLSLALQSNPGWGEWKWSSLLQMDHLSELWISESAGELWKVKPLFDTFRTSILPSLPSRTRFCALRLDSTPWDWISAEYLLKWNMRELFNFANGSWSSRAVLLLQKEPPQDIPQVVIVRIKGEEIWDTYREEVLAVVSSRQVLN